MPSESLFVTAPDGLSLHVARHGEARDGRMPLVCLPGLARTERDFAPLAEALSSDRLVVALDYRGRGRSAYDPQWKNYNLGTELADLLAVLSALQIDRAVFLGTSRGGLMTMLLATLRPDLIAGAILNDIGPAIEIEGLMRIKGYVGKMPAPADFCEGAGMLQRLFGAQFPNLSHEDWLAWARRNWDATPAGLVPRYDTNLGHTLNDVTPEQPLPALWEAFDKLPQVPLMLIRGALTDLLSLATVAEMQRRRPDMQVVDIPDQGHAPLLSEEAIVARIAEFVRDCESDAQAKRR